MIKLKTRIPGPASLRILRRLREKNGGWSISYPLVFSGKGSGPYCEDIDGNSFLDFASQIAANPLGYNHPDLLEVIRSYSGRFPMKFAGQDFPVKEHIDMIEELTGIAPHGFDSAFLINSGAEAVENAMKICMRKRPGTKFGISMERGWHGRTLGALSLTNSNYAQKKNYMRLPMVRLPFDDTAGAKLERILATEASADEIGFVMIEHVQGEGGYRIAPEKMVRELRRITAKNRIPYIADEVQSGIGRTGKWWAFQHYGIEPEVFTCAKALQVGAVVANRRMFPGEVGALSSTWGGGHVLDLALGMKTINIIKKEKMLAKNEKMGRYIKGYLNDLNLISNPRGLGLMLAFDLRSAETRDDLIAECAKNGLLMLGCGRSSIRIIPPYVIEKEDVDVGMGILEAALKKCRKPGFRHKDAICEFIHCSRHVS